MSTPPAPRISAVLAAKIALRAVLATITTQNGCLFDITWADLPINQNQPVPPPDPQGPDGLTIAGETISNAGAPLDRQAAGFSEDMIDLAVVINAAASNETAMTLDDYLDQIEAEIHTAVMADVTLGQVVKNVIYQGWNKQQIGSGTTERCLTVKFGVHLEYAMDKPFGGMA